MKRGRRDCCMSILDRYLFHSAPPACSKFEILFQGVSWWAEAIGIIEKRTALIILIIITIMRWFDYLAFPLALHFPLFSSISI